MKRRRPLFVKNAVLFRFEKGAEDEIKAMIGFVRLDMININENTILQSFEHIVNISRIDVRDVVLSQKISVNSISIIEMEIMATMKIQIFKHYVQTVIGWSRKIILDIE